MKKMKCTLKDNLCLVAEGSQEITTDSPFNAAVSSNRLSAGSIVANNMGDDNVILRFKMRFVDPRAPEAGPF